MGERVSGALESLVERHPGETVVVACHGGVVVHSMLHFLALDDGRRAEPGVDRAPTTRRSPSGASRRTRTRRRTLPVQLVRFNDHAHLAVAGLASGSRYERFDRRRDPARVDVVGRLERAHGEVDGAPQRLGRAEEQQRHDDRDGEAAAMSDRQRPGARRP